MRERLPGNKERVGTPRPLLSRVFLGVGQAVTLADSQSAVPNLGDFHMSVSHNLQLSMLTRQWFTNH